MAMIDLDGLTKRFSDVITVDGLDLHIEKGEGVFGFLGPNGLSMIVALLPGLAETAGAAIARTGVDVEAMPAKQDPFYLGPKIGIVVIGLWLVVPFMIGYYRFDATDFCHRGMAPPYTFDTTSRAERRTRRSGPPTLG